MMHDGHRKRMYEKLDNSENLENHELLEILLFSIVPRVNTNATAHNLVAKFGTLSGIFNADYKQLVSVAGVGAITARHIMCIGECMRRVTNESIGVAVLKNFSDFNKFVVARMRGKDSEILEIYCLDKKGRVLSIQTFSNDKQNTVSIAVDEIAGILSTEKPYGVLIAHNHLSKSSNPSVDDDEFTRQLALLCNINNVKFHDHCIYASDKEVFSYRLAGNLEGIKEEYTLNNLLSKHNCSDLQKK